MSTSALGSVLRFNLHGPDATETCLLFFKIDCARRIFIVSATSAPGITTLTVDASYLESFVLDEPFRNTKEAPPSIPTATQSGTNDGSSSGHSMWRFLFNGKPLPHCPSCIAHHRVTVNATHPCASDRLPSASKWPAAGWLSVFLQNVHLFVWTAPRLRRHPIRGLCSATPPPTQLAGLMKCLSPSLWQWRAVWTCDPRSQAAIKRPASAACQNTRLGASLRSRRSRRSARCGRVPISPLCTSNPFYTCRGGAGCPNRCWDGGSDFWTLVPA